jgi:integral membrane sensor domain MASE1
MRLTTPAARRGGWAESLFLAVAYYGLGRLAWHLGAAPGHAVALWPPAGLTLGLLLVRSPKILLGAVAGGFALGLHAFFPAHTGIGWARALIAAGGFAAAAFIEPLLAAVLVQRLSRLRSALSETRDVARFALLAGPGPALVGAAICNGALYWAKILPRDRVFESFGVWWLGDLLGLLAFAPVVVLLLGHRRSEVSYIRRTAVALTVGAATALAIWVFVRATRWDQRRAEAVVQQRVESITAVVERSLIDHLDALRTLADFIGSSGRVEAATFQRVTTGAVVRHFAYEALAWAPAPMARKPVPVALVEPRAAHETLVGMDLAADEERRQKMAAARHTGEMLVMPVENGDPRALWLFVPAPGRSGEDGIEGFFGAVLRLDRLIDQAVTTLTREGVGVELRESTGGRVVHRAPGTPPASGGVGLPRPVELSLAERRYVLVPVVSRAAMVAQQSTDVWIVLVAGMFFVVLLEGVMLVITGGRRDLEDTIIETPEVVMLD